LALLLILASISSTLLHAEGRDPRRSRAASEEAKRRSEAIRAETAELPAEHWAGEYYAGDGLGVNLSLYLAPEAGFVFEWHGCLGLYDRNLGRVTWKGDHLTLEPVFENNQEGLSGTPLDFRWVRWGARSYLLPNGDVASFCNGLNSGGEPGARLRKRDQDQPVASIDLLPADIRACVRLEPVIGRVTDVELGPIGDGVGEWRYRDGVAQVDFGVSQAPFVGMELYFDVDEVLSATVASVAGARATVEFILRADDSPPEVGVAVSSRPRWAD